GIRRPQNQLEDRKVETFAINRRTRDGGIIHRRRGRSDEKGFVGGSVDHVVPCGLWVVSSWLLVAGRGDLRLPICNLRLKRQRTPRSGQPSSFQIANRKSQIANL